MVEIWKDIDNYEGLYQVSNLGRIKSLGKIIYDTLGRTRIIKEKILANQTLIHGHISVKLYNNGERKHYFVHVLVANAFIPNIENKPQVNHIDGNKKNNRVDNLEWVTCSENIQHAYDNNLKKPPCEKKVLCHQNGVIYKSALECDRQLGIYKGGTCSVCLGIRKSAKGYTFEYVTS